MEALVAQIFLDVFGLREQQGPERILMRPQTFTTQVCDPAINGFAAIGQPARRQQRRPVLPRAAVPPTGFGWVGADDSEVERTASKVYNQDMFFVGQIHTIAERGGDGFVQSAEMDTPVRLVICFSSAR